MTSAPKKLYHKHGFNTRSHTETYVSSKSETFHGDCLTFPILCLHNFFAKGKIGGQVLIDISAGGIIHELLTAVDFFKEIIVLKVSTRCIVEIKKWLSDDIGASDWTHALSYVLELEGKRDESETKVQKLKKAIKQVLKCDIEKDNVTDPVVLQPADCLITLEFLEYISKDIKEYVKNLKKLAALLQPGGHILLFGIINANYIMIGNDSMHLLKMSEDDVRESFRKAGLTIDVCEVQKRKACEGHHLCNYESVIFVAARKPK